MLITYGNTIVIDDWYVDEKTPPGFCRVYYVYSGRVIYSDKHKKIQLKPGRLYVFPSAIPYSMRHDPADPLHCTFIHIDISPDLISELKEIDPDDNLMLKHLFLSLAAGIESEEPNTINALADIFVTYCIEHSFMESSNTKLSNVLAFISTHVDGDVSISTLSKISGYNEQYFIRLFKKTVGLPPHQYIISIRSKEAKKLLKTDMSITHIAHKAGYPDVKSFSRSFKKSFGLSPRAYRSTYTIEP